MLSSDKGHPVVPGDAVNAVAVNDFPGDHVNPCNIQMSLLFNHSIKEQVIASCNSRLSHAEITFRKLLSIAKIKM